MCGFLFVKKASSSRISRESFERALKMQSWRGPDATAIISDKEDSVLLGHNRLAILDPVPRSNQPMKSRDGRYIIVFNGEIYNHHAIRADLEIACITNSDTETIVEGFAAIGPDIVLRLDGMFAFVIYDCLTGAWFSARDRFGIKPLYIYQGEDAVVIGSEPSPIADLLGLIVDQDSVSEWRLMRRPVPGNTYFKYLKEQLPATWRYSNEVAETKYWRLEPSCTDYEQSIFEEILATSVASHELSDVTNVALLSGGLDSAVITALSKVNKTYSTGVDGNNEIADAQETADFLGKSLVGVVVTYDAMVETWKKLTRLRGEPLSVPNEALIYLVCSRMAPEEKVVLTGEGADELLFGYDGIFRWAATASWCGIDDFLLRYGYSLDERPTDRLVQYVEKLRDEKSLIEFVEDFFYDFHLPGLLRRMDFASMAASKEARVPFVNAALASYMYRRETEIKITQNESKRPLRILAEKYSLRGALNRKKIGFSAAKSTGASRKEEYETFQNIVMGELGW